jgi:hypothetical protein
MSKVINYFSAFEELSRMLHGQSGLKFKIDTIVAVFSLVFALATLVLMSFCKSN